jgi:MoaA/NifB/PqqE/SkfB family radical SAM enzyme
MPAELLAQTASSIGSPEETIVSLPVLLLNVHEHCNCRCLMCDIWQRKEGKELDLADFERQRASLVRLGVRQVVLTGGEPLLHRNLEGLLGFLRGCNVSITLLTTGLLLSKRADVVAANVDEIIVSLDGPEEVHDRVRRVKGAYRLIGEGVRAVRQRKADMSIHGRCTVQKENHSLLRKTVTGAKVLGLNSISFLAADVTSQAFNRELVWPGERQIQVVLTRQEVQALEDEITLLTRENDEDIRAKYVSESADKLWRIARRFREQLGEMSPVAPRCNAPWVSAVMEVDGSVRPCFFHKKIGNLSQQTLEQAINGQEAQGFRASLNVSENAICQRCVCSLNYKRPQG